MPATRTLFLVALLFAFSNLVESALPLCNEADVATLLQFRANAFNGSTALGSWDRNTSCCQWAGISCDGSSPPRVVNVSLPGMALGGNFPRALANLTYLQVLNLSKNSFIGGIPSELAKLSYLRIFDISANNLTGDLSVVSSLAPSVQEINLTSNGFSGSLPLFANLSSLLRFWASQNMLTGDVPIRICNSSQYLEVLDLSENNLSGSLLEGFGRCTSLQILDLGWNNLQGRIPLDIYDLGALNELSLEHNNLTGSLDSAVGKLANLEQLLLNANNFSGALPANLSACTKLKIFIANNNSFEGLLDVIDFSRLPMLQSMDLNNNSLQGLIPATLARCANLQDLNLAKNNFTGLIPIELSSLENLSTLSLSSNNLNGSLRLLVQSKGLVSLILSKNNFNEDLPATIEGDGLSDLQVLALGYLHLRGSIPEWLKNCTKLQVLDLSWNYLEGPIPSWLGLLPHLFYVELSNNSFSGYLPAQLFKLPSLMHGDNNITGLKVGVTFAVKHKQGSPELKYTQVSAFPPSLYLSHNLFHGPIPIQVGGLQMLLNMDLSFNNLSGGIPNATAMMMNLESLDLSSNMLTGSIPSSLVDLTFLSFFNVSFNQLVGRIPVGNQFLTFSNKSYEGNAGLCGSPLSRSCHNGTTALAPVASHSKGRSSTQIIILVPVLLIFGLIMVLLVGFSWWQCRKTVAYQRSVSFTGLDSPQNLAEALDSSVQLFCSTKKLTVLDLITATNNFDSANVVGCGGFGLVYRADLSDGSKLAVKRLTGDCGQVDREFQAELETLSKAQHKNLVTLQGYLQIGNERLLLYSYMENGSLDYWLHEWVDESGASLDWPTRLRIAQGAAHGLAYLHQECHPHVVHRDIKSSNILLDEKFQAHLADFGLARLIMSNNTHVTTELVGTLGYIPPEYSHALNATLRGDIYSFGVVLLELLTRQRPVDVCKRRDSCDLVEWVLEKRRIGKSQEIFDSFLLNKGHDEQMLQMLDVACPCLSPDPIKRPIIGDVVNWLDEIGPGKMSTKPLN